MRTTTKGALAAVVVLMFLLPFSSVQITPAMMVAGAFLLFGAVILAQEQDEFF